MIKICCMIKQYYLSLFLSGLLYGAIAFASIFFCTSLFASTYIIEKNNLINQETRSQLEKAMGEIETKDDLFLQIVIMPSLGDNTLEKVLNYLSGQLNQAPSHADNKALLLIVLDNETVVIKTSSDITSIYNEAVTKDITQNIKAQILKKNYDEMARIGVAGVYYYYKKEHLGETKSKSSSKNVINAILLIIIVISIGMLARNKLKKPGKIS